MPFSSVTGNALKPPTIELSPPYLEVDEHSPAQAECRALSASAVAYSWTRLNGELSPDTVTSHGLLRFNSVRPSDVGEYRCVARNQFGEDSRILHVYLRDEQPQPSHELVVHPSYFNGRPGDEIALQCQDNANPNARLEWRREGHTNIPSHVYVDNGALTIQRASPEDAGRYVCANIDVPNAEQFVDVYIQAGGGGDGGDHGQAPTINRFEDLYNVLQGTDFSLVCEASGHPAPTAKWTRVHDTLDPNIQVNGNVLRILNAHPRNRGVYTCVAESAAGTVEESTVIDIERKSAF